MSYNRRRRRQWYCVCVCVSVCLCLCLYLWGIMYSWGHGLSACCGGWRNSMAHLSYRQCVLDTQRTWMTPLGHWYDSYREPDVRLSFGAIRSLTFMVAHFVAPSCTTEESPIDSASIRSHSRVFTGSFEGAGWFRGLDSEHHLLCQARLMCRPDVEQPLNLKCKARHPLQAQFAAPMQNPFRGFRPTPAASRDASGTPKPGTDVGET